MEEALSEPEKDMVTGATPVEEVVPGSSNTGTTRELLQDLSDANYIATWRQI